MEYKIGDILYAISRFHLEDMYGREFYYNIGDQFIIMNVKIVRSEIRFSLNTEDSIFKWYIPLESNEIKKYLVHKKEFIKLVRKQKLNKIGKV